MTDLEKRAITALRRVKMVHGTWHIGRHAFLYLQLLRDPVSRLMDTQASDLWFLVWRYRRQIADRDVVAHSDEIVNGALSLAFNGNSQTGER